ncbi:hypothetical protein QVZ41_06960 [Wenyingzhuangia sp. chi5]|uniref:LVIVD repeat-containing protein n=1 Tax=Wenyingzhuangia gilva TaxID=3057677 RepID=A0ABT8VRK3_9FLAO|nr:hypothetical protein [Wenyingzhuangia sp. chi5]MDO3694584.1 hypothetical protein [Wenyingzhuangia sp. chi5]
MKRVFGIPVLLLMVNCGFLGESIDVESIYEPVEMTREELKSSIVMSDSKAVVESGKIYIKDDYIFVNEKNEGFHIYDNSNPSNPIKVRFLKVPGATDIAIRGNVFYLNQATDLVTLRFNPTNYSVVETGREIKVFTPLEVSPDGGYFTAEEGKIITKFIKKD